jgi:hypothetical protein
MSSGQGAFLAELVAFLYYELRKKTSGFSLLFLTENLQTRNFGREIVFSADLCYNDTGDGNGRTEKTKDHSIERCGL